MSTILLETPRAYLCRLSDEYLDRLVALDADPAVMRYINGGRATPRATMRRKLVDWTAGYERPHPSGFWAAHLTGDDSFIGWVHLRPDREDEHLDELGYRLARRFWDNGLASELARAMIEHTFHVWRRGPVVARTLLANRASQRVMEKCGMYREFEFEYPADRLPGWSRERRRAVRYRIDQP